MKTHAWLQPNISHSPTPSAKPVTELFRHKLEITEDEKKSAAAFAVIGALGNTTGSILTALLYLITPAEEAGIGVTLGMAAGWTTFAITSLATLAVTIPLTTLAYYEFMIEAKALEAKIKEEENHRKKYREALFLELLRLRCLSADEKEFETDANKLFDNSDEVILDKLISLVNEIKATPIFSERCHKIPPSEKEYSLHDMIFDPELERTDANRKFILKNIQRFYDEKDNNNFAARLAQCYQPIEPLKNYLGQSIAYGLLGVAISFGAMMGSFWTVATVLLTAALCASLPGIGWTLLALGCVIGAIGIGILMAKSQNKILQRKELDKAIESRNVELKSVHAKAQELTLNRALTLREQQEKALLEQKEKQAENVQQLEATVLEQKTAQKEQAARIDILTTDCKKAAIKINQQEKTIAEQQKIIQLTKLNNRLSIFSNDAKAANAAIAKKSTPINVRRYSV